MFTPEIFYGVGALILMVVMIWGVVQYKLRNRANDRITDQATKAEYDRPAAYQDEQADFESRTHKS